MRLMAFLVIFAALLAGTSQEEAVASTRFGRRLLEVKDRNAYRFVRLDDVDFPFLEGDSAIVSCVIYRGSVRYYVEVSVTNKSQHPVQLLGEAIRFNKPGYSSFRTNALDAAREAANAAGVPFQPAPPPTVASMTTIDVTETGAGTGYAHVSGTARTGPDVAEQGAANLGNALGNLFAARSFAKAQSEDARFAHFLATFAIDAERGEIVPGATQVLVATFEQVKNKRAPFDVTVVVDGSEFPFHFQE